MEIIKRKYCIEYKFRSFEQAVLFRLPQKESREGWALVESTSQIVNRVWLKCPHCGNANPELMKGSVCLALVADRYRCGGSLEVKQDTKELSYPSGVRRNGNRYVRLAQRI